jgi:hypothetical protein
MLLKEKFSRSLWDLLVAQKVQFWIEGGDGALWICWEAV